MKRTRRSGKRQDLGLVLGTFLFIRDRISWRGGNLSVDLGWKVAWGLSRTQVLGNKLPVAETREGRRSEWPTVQV